MPHGCHGATPSLLLSHLWTRPSKELLTAQDDSTKRRERSRGLKFKLNDAGEVGGITRPSWRNVAALRVDGGTGAEWTRLIR